MKCTCPLLPETVASSLSNVLPLFFYFSASGLQVAIKIIYKDRIKDDYVRRNLHREGDLMRELHSAHVIRLYEIIETGKDRGAMGSETVGHTRHS